MNQDQTPEPSQPPYDNPYGHKPHLPTEEPEPTSAAVAGHLSKYGIVAATVVLFLLAGGLTFMALTGNANTGKSTASSKAPEVTNEVEAVDTPLATTGATAEVELASGGLTPESITVTPGTTVVWKNSDSKTHTLSGDLIGDKNAVDKDSSFSFVYSQPGDYTFTDGTSQGTITVKE